VTIDTLMNPTEQSAQPEKGPQTEAASTSAEDPRDLRIKELEEQLKEKENKYLYLYAEFENAKKRAVKDRSDLIKFGWENVARELLLVLDNFERAMAHIPANTDSNLTEGLKMISSQFKGTLQKQGVQQVQIVGKEFNPELAEAIAQIPSDQPAGIVIKEELPGFTLHGRLLRAANVVVSAGPLAK
jgi:molecular chaperone GrpE